MIREKVLLIQPNYHIKDDAGLWAANPPLGLLYLAAVLEKEKIPVEIIDAHVQNFSAGQTANLIKGKKPKYVGFSIMTTGADWSSEVAQKLPKSIIKIAGGPHASGVPKDILKSSFDIAVIAEGEETLLEIVRGEKLENIKGIFYRKKRVFLRNSPRP